jgi:Fe-S oxidoreductase
MCGGCDIACKYLNTLEVLDVIQTLREKFVAAGVGPMPKQQQYVDAVKQTGNPYNEPAEQRASWVPEDVKTHGDADVAYFVGCTSSYRRQEIATATARVLQASGTRFRLFASDEICCGSPVLRVGDVDTFRDIAIKNIDMIIASGVKTVLFSCAGCFAMFRAEYPRVYREYSQNEALPFAVVSTAEYFSRLIDEKRLPLKDIGQMKVTYHDPCHLGRGSEPYTEWHGTMVQMLPMVSLAVPEKPKRCGAGGVYEEPRHVIASIPGVELVEMDRIKEYAYCCGAGGGVKSAFPDFALHTASTRLAEAESTGASVLVSACPFCSTNLQDAIQASNSALKFLDIAELLLGAIDSDATAESLQEE